MATETQDSGNSMTQTVIWLGVMLVGLAIVAYFIV